METPADRQFASATSRSEGRSHPLLEPSPVAGRSDAWSPASSCLCGGGGGGGGSRTGADGEAGLPRRRRESGTAKLARLKSVEKGRSASEESRKKRWADTFEAEEDDEHVKEAREEEDEDGEEEEEEEDSREERQVKGECVREAERKTAHVEEKEDIKKEFDNFKMYAPKGPVAMIPFARGQYRSEILDVRLDAADGKRTWKGTRFSATGLASSVEECQRHVAKDWTTKEMWDQEMMKRAVAGGGKRTNEQLTTDSAEDVNGAQEEKGKRKRHSKDVTKHWPTATDGTSEPTGREHRELMGDEQEWRADQLGKLG
ncbi:unnamed protein product, partial [Protopolystoma xenopodis]